VISTRFAGALLAIAATSSTVGAGRPAPTGGLTAAPVVRRAYDTVLDADFAALPRTLADTCPPAPLEVCRTIETLGLWWQIALDPENRALDGAFLRRAASAIAAAEAWTRRDPERAEAWFYTGAAYGARAQWRVLRRQRLGAARDGKRIKDSLEQALTIDPTLADANFGIGLYRYYAAVAPAALRMVRWLLLLPGGDRQEGLEQMMLAREQGRVVRSEADYQLHLIFLWYEQRFADGMGLIKELQARHPRNPLFLQLESEIADVYFHDPTRSLRAADDLALRARAGLVNEAGLAEARAHVHIARMLDRLDETDRAVEHLDRVIGQRPMRPLGILHEAAALRETAVRRLAHEPYRLALAAWRAFQRGDLTAALSGFERALALNPSDPVARYRYACVLSARKDDARARDALDRVLAAGETVPPVTRAAAHFDLGRLLEASGDTATAIGHYEAASRVFGADTRVKDAAVRALDRLR
jgi:tetratricopeptide (TPR) repeat protein